MNGAASFDSEYSEFVEMDPTGRYGRYNEVLGKGASKIVYRAFDEFQGMEVAWNQVKLYDFLQNPEDLERLYCEILLLKTLKHKNIMKFYTSWVDPAKRHINFVTEMFTSGTLRQYRLKHKKVSIRAVKHWCRQILEGLLYLHSHEPPVIHRDLKCDNIFINGNQGEVKIGDLGLAAILRKSNDTRCVGTPEFMAPDVYDEDYNELVDIYSFGTCILEMVTLEYPYSECSNPAQIYKKVVSGKKPEALYKVKDPEVREFIEKCLVAVSLRFSAKELLKDPFLQIDDYGSDLRPSKYERDCYEVTPLIRQPLKGIHNNHSSLVSEYTDYLGGYEPRSKLDYHRVDFEANKIDLFGCEEVDNMAKVDTTKKVRRREDDGIFLRLRIADKEGRIRNVYFPFDIETDTAMSVANEMVAELDIIDQDVSKIADMIDNEIANLVPLWTKGPRIEDSPEFTSASFCLNCASLFDRVSTNNKSARYMQILQCSEDGYAAVHRRFEEITYQVEGSECCATETTPAASSQPTGFHYTDIWAQRDELEANSEVLKGIYCHKSHEKSRQSIIKENEKTITGDDQSDANNSNLLSGPPASDCVLLHYRNEIRQELRWLKEKYQMQLRELRDNQLVGKPKSTSISLDIEDLGLINDTAFPRLLVTTDLNIQNENLLLRGPLASWRRFPVDDEKKCSIVANIEMVQDFDVVSGARSLEQMVTAKDFYKRAFLPHTHFIDQPLFRLMQ